MKIVGCPDQVQESVSFVEVKMVGFDGDVDSSTDQILVNKVCLS